jgi:HlyD family secretion protein
MPEPTATPPQATPPAPSHDLAALIAAESVRHRRRRLALWLGLPLLLGALVTAGLLLRPQPPSPAERFRSAPLSRGPVIRQVSPTGRLEARVTVEVGAEISGRITEILVDYNSTVTKGQILARLDPSSLSAQVEQSTASRHDAATALKEAKLDLAEAQRRLAREEKLAAAGATSQEILENARAAVTMARAHVESAGAQVELQSAGARLAKTNLDHTVIRSPIDGVVISRAVDVGQTVAAALQAPVLFTLAEDLRKMRLLAAIDEADIGQISPGQRATFTVDAFPGATFHAAITEIRRAPKLTQNVVTYETVLDVDNPDGRLQPGMTASVKIDTAKVDDALHAPNAALRFTPPAEASPDAASTPASAGPAVWTLAGEQPRRHPVTVGISDGRLTVISGEGLASGQEVLIGLTPAGREHYGVTREE